MASTAPVTSFGQDRWGRPTRTLVFRSHEQRPTTSSMKWLTDPDEALKHPRRRAGALLLVGLILGSYIGYRVLDGSLGWTLVVGTCFGGVLAALETRAMRDPG